MRAAPKDFPVLARDLKVVQRPPDILILNPQILIPVLRLFLVPFRPPDQGSGNHTHLWAAWSLSGPGR
jgi:hypothetical protein